jgi:hypothetical protein
MGKDEGRDEGAAPAFKVEDKRRFTAEGEPRVEGDRPPGPASAPPGSEGHGSDAAGPAAAPPHPAEPAAEERSKLPELDFSTFILSLTTSAMVHLGEAPHPDGTTKRDLTLAKQTIDLIGILKDKTRGNLTDAESRLLDEVLYDLRLRFVSAARR